ncbi:MAG: hypothetical protein V4710_21200 [Verrucomicrobiota bacterium]
MNLFEVIAFSTLTGSVAFCFVFQHRDAVVIAFGAGVTLSASVTIVGMIIFLFRRFFPRAPVPPVDPAPSRTGARFSTSMLALAIGSFVAALGTLWTVPVFPGFAALTAYLAAVSGGGRHWTRGFVLLYGVVLISIAAHIYCQIYPLQT